MDSTRSLTAKPLEAGTKPSHLPQTASFHDIGILEKDQRSRRRKVILDYISYLLLGFSYLIFCLFSGHSLPCPFHAVTGLDCPGCGFTRMMLAIIHGDISGAFEANPALLLGGPLLLGQILRRDSHWIRTGRYPSEPAWRIVGWFTYFLTFTLWRNLS